LKIGTVEELKPRMSRPEFLGWIGFLGLRGETVEERAERVAGMLTSKVQALNLTGK
jgi:hypothetical protein